HPLHPSSCPTRRSSDLARGFDEVQFDYVRFPTDGRLSAAKYASPNNKDTRLPAIAGFLGRARRELGPLGIFVAADIFGYTAFNRSEEHTSELQSPAHLV